MPSPGWWRILSKPVHRLVVIFAVFVMLPGVVLGAFALRSLLRERLIAQQQTQHRLEGIADQTGRDLIRCFQEWRAVLHCFASGTAPDPDSLPEVVRKAFSDPGSGVAVWLVGSDFKSFPPGQLLWPPPDTSVPDLTPEPPDPSVARIETIELVRKDYACAIRLYRLLIGSGRAEVRFSALHRLARTYRKAGRLDEAARTYTELERGAPADSGRLPWSLVAKTELCSIAAERVSAGDLAASAMSFYRDLAEGRWRLEKPRYLYYSDRCRLWLANSSLPEDQFRTIEEIETKKLALARAVEDLHARRAALTERGTSLHLSFCKRDPFAGIVFSRQFLESDWWRRVIPPAGDLNLAGALYSPEGRMVLGVPPQASDTLAVTRSFNVDDVQWHLQLWPRDPAVLYSGLRHQHDVYVGMLILVVALLTFGSYFTWHTVGREWEIARMRADFVSTVSHEFRSPLTGIRQLGEMLLDGRVTGAERQQRYYRMIVKESERLARLVENMLDFSRMEEGRREYRVMPLDTAIWLRGVVDSFQSETSGNGVAIEAGIPGKLPHINGDGEALACAVHNLLDNAVKYSPGSTTVWLDARVEDGTIRISVRDSGVGISEPDRKHVFDKFYRVRGSITQKVKGAGLGLSLVKHIVTAHGGSVECESRVGEGSTFSIRLRAAKPAAKG